MKSLKDYIKEGYSSPDKINFTEETPTGEIIRMFSWNNQSARPFIYAIKQDKTIFGMPTTTHADVVRALRQKRIDVFKALKLDTASGNTDVRWDPEELNDSDEFVTYDEWVKSHKEIAASIHTGRLWDVRLYDDDDSDKFTPALFIAWWDEMNGKEFMNYNTSVINNYFEKKLNIDNESSYIFYCVDNNGDVFTFDLKSEKSIEVDKRSEESKALLKAAKAIHNASQEEKKNFFANFKKTRDEKNQKIYNHTKSKTEAEYRALKYQESLSI